ncbi:UNVERIFIED_CONTAM: hypothetical protein Sradi_2670300 [Sesamum radiatum]|uniref:Uncharacterized protein n=1 Tax=Sesamum radiatum TaxID=300843 RepID=A0AAW2S761_SESRA
MEGRTRAGSKRFEVVLAAPGVGEEVYPGQEPGSGTADNNKEALTLLPIA